MQTCRIKKSSITPRMSNVHEKINKKKEKQKGEKKVKARPHVPNYSYISGVSLEFISSSTTSLTFCPLACWDSFTGGPSGIRRVILLALSKFSRTGPGFAINFLGKELLDKEVEEELQPGNRPDDVWEPVALLKNRGLGEA